jgi:hypothetical protein
VSFSWRELKGTKEEGYEIGGEGEAVWKEGKEETTEEKELD